MRVTRTAAALAAVALAGVSAAAGATAPPALRAKQARAQAVLAQVNALDRRFGRVVDSWDGARIELADGKRRLAANTRALRKARRQSRLADGRLARRLVAIYKDGEPGVVDVVVGASSLSNLLDRLEAADAVVGYDLRLAGAARRAQARLAAARSRLQATERAQRAAVTQLATERRRIGAMLARRRRLLASVRSEVEALKRREAEQQARLAAAARARLARQEARRAAEAAARQAKAAAAAAARITAPAPAPAATAAPAPEPAPATAATPATATAPLTTAAVTTAAAPAAPAPSPGPGHPEAAAVALRYLGIPYRWGGDSPATGFDCSGFVMYVYAQIGIELPHQAAAQYGFGVPVARDQLQPGDLVFYDGLSHVAIYIGNGQVVHAPQTGDVVKISPLAGAGGSYVGARRLP